MSTASVEAKPTEKTDPVSVYVQDRAQIRAIAGARQTVPATIIHEMLAIYLNANPRAKAVATAALAVADTSPGDNPDVTTRWGV
jgi:hypothetical protein